MLLHSAGKEITEDTITNTLTAAGLKPDSIRVKALVAALADVDIDEALKSPVLTAGISPPETPVAPEVVAAPEEEQLEEEKKEAEEDLQGLGALFG